MRTDCREGEGILQGDLKMEERHWRGKHERVTNKELRGGKNSGK